MSRHGQCPRGHALEENAVYCTVCWIRVEPEDPERVAARQRRQRRVWFPLFGATAVVLGIIVGGALASAGGTSAEPPTVVAAGPAVEAPAPATSPVPSASAAEEPVAVTAVPLAATVEEPTVLTVCVPEGSATITTSIRTSADEPWQEVSSTTVLGPQAGCDEGEVEATVTLAEPVADGAVVRIVARDADGERLLRVRVSGA